MLKEQKKCGIERFFGRIEHSRTTMIKELEDWDLVEEMRELNREEMMAKGAAACH